MHLEDLKEVRELRARVAELETENERLREALRIVWQGKEDSVEFLHNCRLQRSQPADEES